MFKTLLLIVTTLMLTGCSLQSAKISEEKLTFKSENESSQSNESVQSTEEDQLYYFGYGSNMDLEIMKQRCGEANFTELGRAILEDYAFYFYGRGYANIKPQNNSHVEGVLHLINDDCLKALDRVEGYPATYQRKEVEVKHESRLILAQVYIVLNNQTVGNPSNTYYQRVIQAATKHNFSPEYIQNIKTASGR